MINKFEDYLDRFAELISLTDDEDASIMIMSIESDPPAAISVIEDLMESTIDSTAERLYTAYAVNEISYKSVKIVIEHFKKLYADRNLPENVPNIFTQIQNITPPESF